MFNLKEGNQAFFLSIPTDRSIKHFPYGDAVEEASKSAQQDSLIDNLLLAHWFDNDLISYP